jgi:hypothetical protein
MKFTGQRKLTEVWPQVQVVAGNPETITFKALAPVANLRNTPMNRAWRLSVCALALFSWAPQRMS